MATIHGNDFPGKSPAWIKGRAAAIMHGDDVLETTAVIYQGGSAEAFDWNA